MLTKINRIFPPQYSLPILEPLGRSRLDVDSMYSLAEANQKFVRDSTGLLCNLLRAEDMAAARPVDQNLTRAA